MLLDDVLLRAEVIRQDGSVVLALTGELDIGTAPVLRRTVAQLVSPHLRALTLDLGGLTFVDVVGLRALVDVGEITTGPGATLRMRNVTDRTLWIIRLAEFEELEEAVEPLSTVEPPIG